MLLGLFEMDGILSTDILGIMITLGRNLDLRMLQAKDTSLQLEGKHISVVAIMQV
jgi:hypothetical protein